MDLERRPPGVSDGFGLAALPYGVASVDGAAPRVVVRLGDAVAAVADVVPGFPDGPSLNAFLAAGPAVWADVRGRLQAALADPAPGLLRPLAAATLRMPFEVADYVDFYSSRHHAENVGRIFRPEQPVLPEAWDHLPIGYHGRAGTVVVSGTPVVRPCGQRRSSAGPVVGPTRRLDVEAEVGFVVGVPSRLGEPVPADALPEHVFGVVLVNDWSARDVQAFEYVPLGPFLGKSFATSVSAWVLPLAALDAARCAPPPPAVDLQPYLRTDVPWGLDVSLAVSWNGTEVSRPQFKKMAWTPAQQLAHLTVNGASLRTGDLYASGTVSGPTREERGCFLELSWGGQEPVTLDDGSVRTFLEDGDEVVITATAPGAGGERVALGEVRGTVLPARAPRA